MILQAKQFEKYISAEEIRNHVKQLAFEIKRDLTEEHPVFLPILNGAFIFAADLIREFDFQCHCSFIQASSYDGTSSTGEVTINILPEKQLKGRKVIILEDIIDTGTTLKKIIQLLEELEVEEIKIATLLFKADAFRENYQIDYIGKKIAKEFVVGYGMDYDGFGRNLKDIYILTEN